MNEYTELMQSLPTGFVEAAEQESEKAADAIISMIVWTKTPDGMDYWNAVYKKCKRLQDAASEELLRRKC